MQDLLKIRGLSTEDFRHEDDKQALLSLEKTPGLDLLVEKFYNLGFEKLLCIEFTGSNLEMTDKSFPEIYEIFDAACDTLDLASDIEPSLYFRWNDYFRILDFPTNNLQGITVGIKKPIIAISSDAISHFEPAELSFIIGSEVGRIISRQVLYEDIARLLPIISEAISTAAFGLGAVAHLTTEAIHIALNRWLRLSDYTADRAGLLACQDIRVALKALAKIAGLPPQYYDSYDVHNFSEQARKFKGIGEDVIQDNILKKISLLQRDQAFIIARAQELLKWIDSGKYNALLQSKGRAPAVLFLVVPFSITSGVDGRINYSQTLSLIDEASHFLCVERSSADFIESKLDKTQECLDDTLRDSYLKIHISDGRDVIGLSMRFTLKKELLDTAAYVVQAKARLYSLKGLEDFIAI